MPHLRRPGGKIRGAVKRIHEKRSSAHLMNADKEVRESETNLTADKQVATKGGEEANSFFPAFSLPCGQLGQRFAACKGQGITRLLSAL